MKLLTLLLFTINSLSSQEISVPTAGNSWVLVNGNYFDSKIVTKEGIRNWSNRNEIIRTFVYLEAQDNIKLGIKASGKNSKLKVTIQDQNTVVNINSEDIKNTYITDFSIKKKGYYHIDIEALGTSGKVFADIDAIVLKNVDSQTTKFVKDDFYFGRRGPSVHLRFNPPETVENVEWFYSEILIPKGEDVIGSYFMANGFGEGYFGIQVNSKAERRILFSIWSPFKTDKPSEVPLDYRITLLKKGEGVTSGKFGDEGSGGQSYKVFNWKVDLTYGFLIGAKPDDNGNTIYTAYFHDPELNKWNLIAQFKRPKTSTYLKRLYSFLENFIPYQGVFARKGLFMNQWVYGNGAWYEITDTEFTADNTARKENRFDYSGGAEGNAFYLKNCGFTNDRVLMNSKFTRTFISKVPNVVFSELE